MNSEEAKLALADVVDAYGTSVVDAEGVYTRGLDEPDYVVLKKESVKALSKLENWKFVGD